MGLHLRTPPFLDNTKNRMKIKLIDNAFQDADIFEGGKKYTLWKPFNIPFKRHRIGFFWTDIVRAVNGLPIKNTSHLSKEEMKMI